MTKSRALLPRGEVYKLKRRRAAARGLLALSLFLSLYGCAFLYGCASSLPPLPPLTSPRATEEQEPWRLPKSAFPTQRLYRVKYRGPEGDLAFKLTLYLQDRDRYEMRAVARFGRRLWSLRIEENNEALWLDHRQKEYCQASDASTLTIVPLARLPLSALPKFLLGRFPVEPAGTVVRVPDGMSYFDVHGQKWSGALVAGRLVAWGLTADGEPVASWQSQEAGGVFWDREGQQRVEWQEVSVEPLTSSLAPVQIPDRYETRACEDYILEESPSSTG